MFPHCKDLSAQHNKLKKKSPIPRHINVKFQNSQDKQMILRIKDENKKITYEESRISVTDFLITSHKTIDEYF